MDDVNNNGQLSGFEKAKMMGTHEQMALLVAAAVQVADATEKTPNRGSRADFFKAGGAIEQQIHDKIKSGELQVDDAEILITTLIPASAGKSTVNLFESKDVIEEGLRSLTAGKTEKDFNMVLSSIRVTAAVVTAAGAVATQAEILAANFRSIETIPSLRNAVLSLKAGNRIILTGKSLNGFYDVDNDNHTHEVELDNPKFIRENEKIDAKVVMTDGSAIPAFLYLRVTFKGTGTSPRSN